MIVRLARVVAALLAQLALAGAGWAAASGSPVGTWRTFDDGGQETGLVAIESVGGVLSGTVAGIIDPGKRAGLCQHCPDDRRDRPVLGLQIIRGVKPDGDIWDGGNILDPETGGVYRVKMRLVDGGAKLVLRGFIGISLFGRTQTWLRAGGP